MFGRKWKYICFMLHILILINGKRSEHGEWCEQCTDVGIVRKRLEEMGMRYVTAVVEDDDGNKVDQVFFHDPDGYMIEICNCENIPIIPISSCSLKPRESLYSTANPGYNKCGFMETVANGKCGFMETVMMESLSKDMMNFSF